MLSGKQALVFSVPVFVLLCLAFSGAFAAVWIYDDGGGGGKPIQQLQILSPTTSSPVSRAEGESVSFSFNYNYWCPSGYAVEIYRDGNPSDLVCSKTVVGMGWLKSYTYSGIACEQVSGSNTVQDVCGISTDATDGSYTLKLILFDYSGDIVKTDYETSALRLQTAKADLLVSSVQLDKSSVTLGGKVGVTAVIENNGFKDAGQFKASAYYADESGQETLFSTVDVSSLVLGSNKTLNFSLDSGKLTIGSYTVTVKVDPFNVIPETNEENNAFPSTGFSVSSAIGASAPAIPDLFISSFSSDKNAYDANGIIHLSVGVSVKGADVMESFLLSIYSGDTNSSAIESRSFGSLTLTEGTVVEDFNFDANRFAGTSSVKFIAFVDSAQVVSESTNSNNEAFLDVNLVQGIPLEACYNGLDDDGDGLIDEGCLPDLFVEKVQFIFDGANQAVSPNTEGVFVFNGIPSSIRIPVEVGQLLGEDKDLLSVFARNSLCVSLLGKNYSFGVKYGLLSNADYSVAENSTTYTEFLDLAGSLISRSLLINGTEQQILESYDSILLSGIDWFGQADSGFLLNPVDLNVFGSDFTLNIKTNCGGTITESNEQNNSLQIPLKFVLPELCNGVDDDYDGSVDEGCDISASSFSITENPQKVPNYCPVELKGTITNNGLVDSPPLKVGLYNGFPGTGKLLNEETIDSIPASESKEVIFRGIPLYFTSSSVGLYLFVDKDSSFFEENELNNYKQLFLSLVDATKPNLSIELGKLDREIFALNSRIPVQVIVKNVGYKKAENIEFAAGVSKKIPAQKTTDLLANSEKLLDERLSKLNSLPWEGISCPNPFKRAWKPKHRWNDDSKKKPADYIKGDPDVFLQYIALYDYDLTKKYFISSIHFFDQYGNCDIEVSSFRGGNPVETQVVGYFTGPCDEAYGGPIYKNFIGNSPREEHMFEVVGWLKADFTKLNSYYWKKGDVGHYAPKNFYEFEAEPKIKVFPSAKKVVIPQKIFFQGGSDGNTDTNESFFTEYNTAGKEGKFTLVSCVDANALITETNEEDNCAEVEFMVSDKPNLKFSNVSAAWVETPTGKALNLVIEIKNNGVNPSGIPFSVSIYRSTDQGNKSLGLITGISLASDETITITKSFTLSNIFGPVELSAEKEKGSIVSFSGGSMDSIELQGGEAGGNETVYVLLDSGNAVDEADEEDNQVGVDIGPDPATEEICGDNVDNDLDGLTDEGCVELCGNSVDDDGDGLVDEGCGEVCGDGIDNDLDGAVDEGCSPYLEEVCGDNKDNDLDGLVDEGCKQEAVEVCGNGIDDDFDELVDEGCVERKLEEGLTPKEIEGIKKQYAFKAFYAPVVVGKTQTVSLIHSTLGPVVHQVITVTPPSGAKPFELLTNQKGEAEFEVKEIGKYLMEAKIKTILLQAEFQSIAPQSITFSSLEEFALFFFGETVRENLFFVPLLLLLSLTVAFLVFNRTRVLFDEEAKPSNVLMIQGLVRLFFALVFFFVPLIVNRFVSFNYAVIVVVAELVLVLLMNYFLQRTGKKEKGKRFVFKLSI